MLPRRQPTERLKLVALFELPNWGLARRPGRLDRKTVAMLEQTQLLHSIIQVLPGFFVSKVWQQQSERLQQFPLGPLAARPKSFNPLRELP